MKNSIGKTISKSIKERKWLSVDYVNKEGVNTSFWCNILDVNIEKKTFKATIFNIFKDKNTKEGYISFEGIKKADILDGTYYDVDESLLDKLEKNVVKLEWLEYDNFNDKILDYYSDVKKLDNDPYQREYVKIKGIDANKLLEEKRVSLDDEQFDIIVKDIYHNDLDDYNKKMSQLAVNKMAICDEKKHVYIVAYYPLSLDIRNKELVIKNDLIINKSFLIEGKKISLSSYLTISIDVFLELIHEDFTEAKEMLRDNLRSSEKIDENPLIMLIDRDFNIEYDGVYEYISECHKEGNLSLPLKAFFGEMSIRNLRKVEPNIVLLDNRADIDQVRVVYNAMKNPVTYVQGPPGTGKTTTILNVILSAFLNQQKCLLCSNNNLPIDGILEKIDFECKYGKVLFPIIRLGNRNEMSKALVRIKELIDFKDSFSVYEDRLKQLTKETIGNYKSIKDLLTTYEKRKQIEASIEYSKRFSDFVVNNSEETDRLVKKLSKKQDELKTKLDEIPIVTNEDVLSNIKSAIDDPNYMMYLFFNSIKYIKRLQEPSLKELREIVANQDEEERINLFTKYLRKEENFIKFQRVFPIIACTNVSCLKLGSNNTYFDICIMDEAGQCDVAASLVPISKAKNLLLVGDVNQLQPVITIDDLVNDRLLDKYEVPGEYDYCHNSIINLMTTIDNISPTILLSYHYRCGKRIADYSNKRYYNGKLNIKTQLSDNQLEYVKVKNDFFGEERNSYLAEAKAVVRYIVENKLNEDEVSIITPFRNQAALLSEELRKRQLNVKCGTIHTVQGAENKTVIFSPCIGFKSSRKTYEWLANNKELINVAVTRAKDKLVLVADEDALQALKSKEQEDDIIALSDYIKEKGKVTVSPSSLNKIEIGLSNGSECENELFDTISHFCSVYSSYSIKRNRPVVSVLKEEPEEKLSKYFRKAEFDLVIYTRNLYNKMFPRIAIELNGGEHYISKSKSIINDRKKMAICRKYGIKYLSVPNAYSKSYETLSSLIIALNGEEDIEEYTIFNFM